MNLTAKDWHVLAATDKVALISFLDRARDVMRAGCADLARTVTVYRIQINAQNATHLRQFPIIGEWEVTKQQWKLTDNTSYFQRSEEAIAATEREKAEAARRAAEKVAAEKDARVKLQRDFFSKHGLAAWTNGRQLNSNPFLYKDKVVGLFAWFEQMNSENEASFGVGDGAQIIVTGVNPTQFRAHAAHAVLAIRVGGIKQVDTPFGKMGAAYGSFVGIYFCSQRSCAEFFN